MRSLRSVFVLLLVFLSSPFAAYVAVLETVADGAAKEIVSATDRLYLTNVLREEAVNQLPPQQNYTIMTSENIQVMLPPGKTWDDYCDDNTCLVDFGKKISADYICQARIGSFGSSLTLSAVLYETDGNKLMASINGRGADVDELLELVKQKAPDFFRSIKGNFTGFSGVGGIGDVSGADEFRYAGRKKFIVELTSEPAGALPTIDGKGIPKCTSTPCKVQVEEGNHRIVMTKERYDDAEAVVDIKTNNQRIALKLPPNFGFLDVKPVLAGNAAYKGKLNIVVDGSCVKNANVLLDPGVHSVRITHPCYDPVEFKVSIVKNKTEVFDKEMTRGKGALELDAEYRGEPQAVAVFIDGVESGSTPYSGEVPLCAEVMLKDDDWTEKVNVIPKWHEMVRVTHRLVHAPEGVAMVEDATRANAKIAYDELDGESGSQAGKSVPVNVKSGEEDHIARWVVLGVSVAAGVTGTVIAVVGNNQAKSAADKGGDTVAELEKNKKEAKSGQTLRGVGIGLAIAGAVGIGISFAF